MPAGRFRFSRRRLVALLVGGFAARASSVAASPSGAVREIEAIATRASDYCPDTQEREFLTRINNLRASRGLGALKLSRKLGAAAEHHSIDMANKNYFSHTFPTGTTWSQNLNNHGYTYNTYKAENIAAGYQSASKVYSQWKQSSGHYANMVSPNFKAIGIGRAYNANSTYKWYWTTTFGGVADTGVTAC